MRKQINFYLGEENLTGFTGFLAEENLFLIIEIKENFTKEEGNKLISEIKQKFISQTIENLHQLDNFIKQVIIENNLPTDISLAVIFFKDNIAYLKTVNEAVIFLRRKNKVEELISGTQTASGYIQFDDIFILTTVEFINQLKKSFEIKNVLNKKEPEEIINEIAPFLKANNDYGLIALFVKIKKDEERRNYFGFLEDKNFFSLFNQSIGRKKTLTYLLILIIFFIFVWSVILGYQRRKESEINNRIEKTKKIVTSKLEEAEEIAFLNLDKASQLLSEAKKEVSILKQEVKTKNKKLEEIEKIIAQKESEIIKKETKNYQEFYDLAIDRKEAKGERFFLQNDSLFILDKDGGVIYRLSLEKKSLEKYSHPKIKKSSLIASYEEKIYFFVEDEGIFETLDKDKIKKIIEKDPNWGKIQDVSTYNGNLYLLDVKNDEIYKYFPSGNGFSSKTSYFKMGEAVDLEDANSLAIDSAIYIGFSQSILKFISGVKEDFKNNFPNKNLTIKKIYTDKELNKVYVFDKENGLIYVLTKNGDYQQQISSEVIKKASDFVVYKDKIFLLLKNKIYTIE
jgi:hypothetical protein